MPVVEVQFQEVHNMMTEGIRDYDFNKVQTAENIFHQILNKDPDNWHVLFCLGTIFLWREQIGLAISSLKRCVTICEEKNYRSPELYNNIGTAYRREHNNDEARKWFEKGLEISPNDPDLYNNLCTLFINEGKPELGEPFARKAIELKPEHGQVNWNLALLLLEQEKWEEGFKQYAWGLTSKDRMSKDYVDKSEEPAVWYNGTPDKDKVIVIYGEQGIGDEIMFASLIPEIQQDFKHVIFDCHPRLINLFQRSFTGNISFHPTRKDLDTAWAVEYEEIHYKTAIGNICRYYRNKEEDFPKKVYLKADPDQVKAMEKRLVASGPGPYIGISWVGGYKQTRKDLRCVLMENWLPIFNSVEATWVSLQYTDQQWELDKLEKEQGIKVHHWPEVVQTSHLESWELDGKVFKDKNDAKIYSGKSRVREIKHNRGPAHDYEQVAALIQAISNLGGCLVTINTSLCHLAGAMGVKTFVMTPDAPAWRYGLTRKDMVWYGPWLQQYRQIFSDEKKWDRVINLIANDLKEFYELRAASK